MDLAAWVDIEYVKELSAATIGRMGRFEFQTEPLDEHEDVLGVFYGSRGEWGAQFVVTNRRMLFGPLDTSLAEEILSYGFDKAGVPGIDFVKSVLERYGPRSCRKDIYVPHNGEGFNQAHGNLVLH